MAREGRSSSRVSRGRNRRTSTSAVDGRAPTQVAQKDAQSAIATVPVALVSSARVMLRKKRFAEMPTLRSAKRSRSRTSVDNEDDDDGESFTAYPLRSILTSVEPSLPLPNEGSEATLTSPRGSVRSREGTEALFAIAREDDEVKASLL